ncbi:MAG: ribosomal RNA small subunit methyltransferase A [Armatimonadetes bacterium]|nr:ribosomal RNA small subunit methyltransferase A [Armatimonadota bacterium]
MLARHGVRPDKRLGQHFLVSGGVISQIVARVGHCRGVLEIGPGPGVLTAPLSDTAETIAVELDQSILPVLREVAPRAEIIEGDALEVDLAQLLEKLPSPRALVSNMPYNITGPLLDAFSRVKGHYSLAVLMMQREVAEKILAVAGDRRRGALSVVMQANFEVTKVCNAPAGAFLPPPKVDSTVLQFVPKSLQNHEEAALDLARAAFAHPRKTLANNLKGTRFEQRTNDLERMGLSRTVRPHELTWEQWLALAN